MQIIILLVKYARGIIESIEEEPGVRKEGRRMKLIDPQTNIRRIGDGTLLNSISCKITIDADVEYLFLAHALSLEKVS